MDDATQQQTTIPDQFIRDIVDTACLTSIDYWCDRVTTKINLEGLTSTPAGWNFYETDEDKPVYVSIELLRKTLTDIVSGRIECSEGLSQAVSDALAYPDDVGVYIDAAYSDYIVQLACFGEERYA